MTIFLALIVGALLGTLSIYILRQFYDRFQSDGAFMYIMYSLCAIAGGSIGLAVVMAYQRYIIIPLIAAYIALKCLETIFV